MTRHAVPEPAQVAAADRPTPREDISVTAILLLAYVKGRALTRTDQDSTNILVRRDLLVRLAAAVERSYPGELDRLRRVIDAPHEGGPS